MMVVVAHGAPHKVPGDDVVERPRQVVTAVQLRDQAASPRHAITHARPPCKIGGEGE